VVIVWNLTKKEMNQLCDTKCVNGQKKFSCLWTHSNKQKLTL
jgi:hypothetical protein